MNTYFNKQERKRIKKIIKNRRDFIKFFVISMFSEIENNRFLLQAFEKDRVDSFIDDRMFRYRTMFRLIDLKFSKKVAESLTTKRRIKREFLSLREKMIAKKQSPE
ncbi:MAG: hypothetical protein PHC89_02935 [Candidatus Pacebacteria bacterium]|nr:hypothetical protein [Candidatus Paceibacterota bacterium]